LKTANNSYFKADMAFDEVFYRETSEVDAGSVSPKN